jgi:O-antigen chain-terminating methyltransferase
MGEEKEETITEIDFYRVLEDFFRGSRELIQQRLNIYLPFLNSLKLKISSNKALDLGCGRGEWLELLAEKQFDAHGVDLNKAMVATCHELGLNALKGDAIEYLQTVPSNSIAIVSAFHLIEHIPFDKLYLLVQHAFRILVPGGLLVLETPNAENLVVGTNNFYLDPTHNKPVPADLLSFLTQINGFNRFKILRLQENINLNDSDRVTLWDVLSGASPDYAIVAQKNINNYECEEMDFLFKQDQGIMLSQLAQKHQSLLDCRFDNLHLLISSNEVNAQHAVAKAQQAEIKAQQAETKAQQAETKAQQAEVMSHELLSQVQALYCSRSWRFTRPFRWAGEKVRKIYPKNLRQKIKIILQHATLYFGLRPKLKKFILIILNRLPSIKLYIYHHRNKLEKQTIEPIIHTDFLPPEVYEIYRTLVKKVGE